MIQQFHFILHMHQQQLEVCFTLSSLGMNKTAFGPNNLQTSNITYDLVFFFLKEFSGRNNRTGTVFTWGFYSEVFRQWGRRQRHKPLRLKLYPIFLLAQYEDHPKLEYWEEILPFYDYWQWLNSKQFWKLLIKSLVGQLRCEVYLVDIYWNF